VLFHDLLLARGEWFFRSTLDNPARARQQNRLFRAVADRAAKLKEALHRDDSYAARCLFPGKRGKDFLDMLDGLAVKGAERLASDSPVRLDRSPISWFVGEVLPPIFDRNYGRTAGISRNPLTGKVSGPYVRFAVAVVMELLGRRISGETVAGALKGVKSKRTRRIPRAT
jgi:hypothetical protein